ncbi:hypothetical protein NT6N_21580 [Oceaniferula spumae]|uniref:PEP-CTERM protein-sorting domain-containing protein n=1 Tax=Oceaniferula spumae TaxID=2979115 RepID=A0AAT9FMC7_9BACT
MFTAQAATVLNLGTNFGGRFEVRDNGGVDYTPGSGAGSLAGDRGFRTDRATLGDDGSSNEEFLQVWAFVVTTDFKTDLDAGNSAVLAFNTGATALNGTPSTTSVYFLGMDDNGASSVNEARAISALEGSAESLGSFAWPGLNQDQSFSVSNAQLAGANVGDLVYFALDGVLNTDGIGQSYKPASTVANENALAGITLTTVPEPSAAALLGLAGSLALLRRRK